MAIGTIGVPVSSARWKPPFFSAPISPVSERVPSGAIHTLTPRASCSPAWCMLAMARR